MWPSRQQYFTIVGQDYAHKIPKTNKTQCQYLKVKLNNTIYLNPTDQKEISKIINELKPKTSSGHDSINSNILKSLNNELKLPISMLTNLSLIKSQKYIN